MKFLKPLAFALSTGYILFFYSELVFWARPRPEDSLLNWLWTWLAYSLSGLAFLAALRGFRVKNIWGLFLCGALFGWLTEGVIVQTMYAAFPLQISWTGLAWHALISVWIGWYALRRALHQGRMRSILGIAAGLGLFWGVWGIFWWVEEPGQPVASLGEFAAFALVSSLLLIVAYWLADRTGAGFAASGWVIGIVAALFVVQFFVTALPAAPLAAFVLPPLLLVIFLILWRGRKGEQPGSLLDDLAGQVPGGSYLALLAMPAVAILVYAAALALDLRLYTGWLVYALTMPLGFILLVVSVLKVLRPNPQGGEL
jgi:hypothetical protein